MSSNLNYIQYTEPMAGAGGAFTDTLNRALRNLLAKSGYNPDAATFSGLFGPVFNVRAYGAVGDSVTDDLTAFNLAIADAVAAGGGIVFVPAGTYVVSAPVMVPRYVTLKGAGRTATNLSKLTTTTATGTSAVAKDAVLYLNGPSVGNFAFGIRVQDMTLTTSSTAANSCGLFFGNVAQSMVENVNIQGGFNATASAGAWMLSMRNVRGGSNLGYSFDFSTTDEKTTLALENVYSEASAGGFTFNRARYSSMRSCGADYCNSGGAPGNPYGAAAKGTYTALSVCYNFVATSMSMTGCGAEFAYCDFAVAQASSYITMSGCYVAGHSLSYTGASRSAFISTADLDGTDNRIIITGCDFSAVTKTGAGTAIYGYFAGGSVSQIIIDKLQTVAGSPLAQTSGRVYDLGNVLRGTLPTVQTAGQVFSQSNSLLQTTGTVTTHYTLTAPGIYDVAAYGYGGVNFVADATVALSSSGVLTLLRTNSSSGSFAITVSGANVQITQSNGTSVTVGSVLLNRLLA